MNIKSKIKHNTSEQLVLSIIVPVYNAERYLEECLRSLYMQDMPMDEYEVIAVDNGSRDSSAAIINRLQTEYPNLRKVTLEVNQLPSGGRNAGLDAAQGKYLMFVDSDDYLYPNVLQSLIGAIEAENLDFVHFESDTLYEGVITKNTSLPSTPIVTGAELYFSGIKLQGVSWNKIYKRQFIEEHHLRCDRSILYEDDEFAYRLFAYAQRVRHISCSPYVYRTNPYSATKNRVNLPSMQSDMNEIQALERDIRQFKQMETDNNLIIHMEKYLRWMIGECFRIYHQFPKEQQPQVRRLYHRSFTCRMLPYMSRKRFVLLKLGIIR